ncbi:hypothetical protein ACFFF8_13705 [Novosphingobium clariflavum]|uniref:Secreted protein n=1 Tax=Novosphingobium clariflavum TaxID=2029884 RepID=A0ABV6S8S8_9SPHN
MSMMMAMIVAMTMTMTVVVMAVVVAMVCMRGAHGRRVWHERAASGKLCRNMSRAPMALCVALHIGRGAPDGCLPVTFMPHRCLENIAKIG